MKRAYLWVVLLLPLSVPAQDSCTAIRAAKGKTYGFKPTTLDKERQNAKSKEMDAFWDLVKKDGKNGAACLRDLLTGETEDGFFLFDGASLLFGIEPSKEITEAVLASLLRADLDQVDPGGHVSLLMRLARANADVGPHARRYLEQKKADSYLPVHSMKMDRFMGALLIYGLMPVEQSDRYLTEALESTNKEAQSVAARVLALNLTEASFRALAEFKGMAELPEEARKEIASLRTHSPYSPFRDPSKFSRADVLDYLRMIPHTYEEITKALERQRQFEDKHPEFKVSTREKDYDKVAKAMQRKLEESPPFLGVSSHRRFSESAIATLIGADLPAIQEARRKAIHGPSDETMYEFHAYTRTLLGVINRLDLYKEHRVH